jgi:hypothetical protein
MASPYFKPSFLDIVNKCLTHLLATFFLDPVRLTFFPDRTRRTLGEDRTFRALGDLDILRLTFFPVDFLTRGIFNNKRKKIKNFLFSRDDDHRNDLKDFK